MSWWVKLPVALGQSPALLTVSLAARGLFFQLYALVGDDGRIACPAGATQEQLVEAIAHDPHNPRAAVDALDELTTRGLVVVRDGMLFVPARVGVDVEGRAVQGVGSRGGRTSTERARERREKIRATGCNGTMQRNATGDATECNGQMQRAKPLHATENATGHMVTQPAVNTAQSTDATEVQRNATVDRVEKNREEDRNSGAPASAPTHTREAPTRTPDPIVPDQSRPEIPAGYRDSVLEALRTGAGDVVELQSPPFVELRFVRLCLVSQYVAQDLRTLGEFLASGKSWSKRKRFDLSFLSMKDGEILLGLMTDARSWSASRRPPTPPEPPKPSGWRPGVLTAEQQADQKARLAKAMEDVRTKAMNNNAEIRNASGF